MVAHLPTSFPVAPEPHEQLLAREDQGALRAVLRSMRTWPGCPPTSSRAACYAHPGSAEKFGAKQTACSPSGRGEALTSKTNASHTRSGSLLSLFSHHARFRRTSNLLLHIIQHVVRAPARRAHGAPGPLHLLVETLLLLVALELTRVDVLVVRARLVIDVNLRVSGASEASES